MNKYDSAFVFYDIMNCEIFGVRSWAITCIVLSNAELSVTHWESIHSPLFQHHGRFSLDSLPYFIIRRSFRPSSGILSRELMSVIVPKSSGPNGNSCYTMHEFSHWINKSCVKKNVLYGFIMYTEYFSSLKWTII